VVEFITKESGGFTIQRFDSKGNPRITLDRVKQLHPCDPLKDQTFRAKKYMKRGDPFKHIIITQDIDETIPCLLKGVQLPLTKFVEGSGMLFGRALNYYQDPRDGAIFASNPIADVDCGRHIVNTCSSQYMSATSEALYLLHWAAAHRRGVVVFIFFDINKVHGKAVNPLPHLENYRRARNFAQLAHEVLIQGAVYCTDIQICVVSPEMFEKIPHFNTVTDTFKKWCSQFTKRDLVELHILFKEGMKISLPKTLLPPPDEERTVYMSLTGLKYHLKEGHYNATEKTNENRAKKRGKKPCTCVV